MRELTPSDPALVNAFSPDGFQPLGYVCFFGRREVAEVLLAAGAELESAARNAIQGLARDSGHVAAAALFDQRN